MRFREQGGVWKWQIATLAADNLGMWRCGKVEKRRKQEEGEGEATHQKIKAVEESH